AAAVEARRGELEQLVDARVDAVLHTLAAQLVEAKLVRRCARCGGFPLVPKRTLCRDCHRARTRFLPARRVRRRNGTGDDAEEPAPAGEPPGTSPRSVSCVPVRSPVGEPDRAALGNGWPDKVPAGIAAQELARRSGGVLSADALAIWL